MALAQPRKQLEYPLHLPWLLRRADALLRHQQVFLDRERGKDAASLRHQADAELRDALGAKAADRLTEQSYLAFRGLQEADDGRDAGGLAGAVASEQRQHAARPQRKADAVQDMAVAIKGVQVGQAERVRGQDTPPASVRPRSRHRARRRR